MKKIYFLFITLMLSLNSIVKAQIATYIPETLSTRIFVEGDYLYYSGLVDLDQLIINRINLTTALPTIELLYTIDDPFPTGGELAFGMVKNGNHIYLQFNDDALGASTTVYDLDLANPVLDPPVLFNCDSYYYPVGDLAYFANYLYRTPYGTNDVFRYNVTLTSPLTESVYLNFDGIARPYSLHIDGITLYIGLANGQIYTKNLAFASPATLLYTSPFADEIYDLITFDGYIYFADPNGIHRFDPLDPTPTTQTIATPDDFSVWDANVVDLAAKSLVSGEKYLYCCTFLKIYRIDLNHPSLSITEHASGLSSAVYPNPATTNITIKTFSEIKDLTFYDILGKKALSVTPQNSTMETSIDISTLEKGMYQLKIETVNGVETKKVIKK